MGNADPLGAKKDRCHYQRAHVTCKPVTDAHQRASRSQRTVASHMGWPHPRGLKDDDTVARCPGTFR